MRTLALVLMLALPAQAQDAGVDAGSDSKGVYRVVNAEQPDGGSLGPGWYLTSDKLTTVGSRLVILDNENRQMKADLLSAPRPTLGFWVGMVLGVTVGISGTVFIVKALK